MKSLHLQNLTPELLSSASSQFFGIFFFMRTNEELANDIMAAGQFGGSLEACTLLIRNQQIELLEKYSIWLTKHGYMDTDWKDEEPKAIDEFLSNQKL